MRLLPARQSAHHADWRQCGSDGHRSSFAFDRELLSLAQVTVQYNLCNEPWVKYSMAGVSDRGLAPSLWTSARLHHHVLYLETHK